MAHVRPRRSLLRRAPALERATGRDRVAPGAPDPLEDEVLAAEEADEEALACFEDEDLDQTLDRAETRTLSVFSGRWDPSEVVEVEERARGSFEGTDREDAEVYEEDDDEDWGWDDPTEAMGPRISAGPGAAEPTGRTARRRLGRSTVLAVVLGSGGLMAAGGLLVVLGLGAGLALWLGTDDAPGHSVAVEAQARPVAPPILQPAAPEGPAVEAPTPEISAAETQEAPPSARPRRASTRPAPVPAAAPVEEPELPVAEPEPVPEPEAPEAEDTPEKKRRGLFRRKDR